MTFAPKSILIIGGFEPFGIGFINSLHQTYGNEIIRIVAFGIPYPDTNLNQFSNDLLENNKKFKIFFGDNKNEKLITKIVQELEVIFPQ